MKFSCVTLSFNQGKYLSEAINSILGQGTDIDYVVFDPGSIDKSRELIASYENLGVTPIFVDGDLGPADGLNQGLGLIDGDIFYYLNADDRVLPGAFQFVNQYFNEHPDCDILHGSINLIDQSGNTYRTLPAMRFSLQGYALGYSFVYQQATFIRKSIIPKSTFNIYNKVSWDGELICDLVLAGASIHQTQVVLGEFRIYSTSITGSGKYVELAKQEHKRIAKRILGRNPYRHEILGAFIWRNLKAISRRLVPRIETLN